MSKQGFKRITVVGVGLLGGSVGLAAKACDERVRVTGVGRRMESLSKALSSGAIDRATLDLAEGVSEADLVVLATPLGSYEQHLSGMVRALPRTAVVTDVGSTKALVVRVAERILGRRRPFVGSHPMAGGERRGPEYARTDLFRNATCIVTTTPRTSRSALRRVEAFWRSLGAFTVRMTPAQHDAAVARVSHLPHVLAALAVAIQNARSRRLAGPGFLDLTRVASGDPGLWREIILTNRRSILAAIDDADEELMRLRDQVELGDAGGIERYLARAKARRDQLLQQRLKRQE